jgi:hypothetical protein
MNEVVKPPIVAKADPITEGVQARLRHLREVITAFSGDLREMERLEKALLAATDRLDRHTQLIGMETQLLEQLLKRDTSKPPVAKGASVVPFVDHVEEALQTLTSGMKAS